MHRLTVACAALTLAALGSASIAAKSRDEKTQRVDALFERWERSDSPTSKTVDSIWNTAGLQRLHCGRR